MRIFTLFVFIVLCTGCGSSAWERTATASSVGCKPEQVKVVSKDSGAFDNIQSWYADCRGTRYRCVFVPGNKGGCYPVTVSAS
jgi:hypothetical protein